MSVSIRAFRLPLQALVVGFLIFLVGTGSAPATTAEQSRRFSPNSTLVSYSIAVIGSEKPTFDTLLNKFFPGLSQVPDFLAIRPLLAIVHNNTLRVVRAYVIKWSITEADGTVVTATLPAVWQPPPGGTDLVGSGNVLSRSGTGLGTVLVSPFFRWPKRLLPSLIKGNLAFAAWQAASLRSLTAAARNATSVRVTLDGAIFGDGRCVGPDRSKLFERFQAEQAAEVDEAKWMEGEFKNGITDQQLRHAISEQIYRGSSATAADGVSLYAAARGRAASIMLGILDLSGRNALEEFSLGRAAAQPLSLRRKVAK